MTDPLNDASTDVDARCKKFFRILGALCTKAHEDTLALKRARTAAGPGLPKAFAVFPKSVTFRISKNRKAAGFRTPKDQAERLVASEKTGVCWSAHMSDKGRHIVVRVNGAPHYGVSSAFPYRPNRDLFRKLWGQAMAKAGLVNHAGRPGMGSGDEFHLELPASKIGRKSARANACMDEYMRLTRKLDRRRNTKLEKHVKLIQAAAKRTGLPAE